MTKDRLGELQTAMNNSQNETIGMQSMTGSGGVANSAYMNEFYAEIDEINNRIRTIDKNVESASRLYGKVLATPNNDTTLNSEIEDLTFSIKRSAVDVKDRIKKLEYQVQSERLSPTEFRVKKNQLTNSMDQFKRIMDRYYKLQSEHRDNCKNRIQRQMEIAGKPTSNEDVEKMLESGNAQIFTAEVLSDVKMAKQTLDYIEARHQDIIKLERDILELNEMFLDMSILIQQQGDVVDNIENNAFTVIENVETADEKLKSAHENQKSARKKKILVIIIIAVVILIILGIIAIILAVYIPRPSNNNG